MKKYLLLALMMFFSTLCLFSKEIEIDSQITEPDSKRTELKKSQLLVKKGDKAGARGEVDEAVAAYEEAYEACNTNILPLVKIARIYSEVGMYNEAEKRLNSIPIDRLKPKGQSEVFRLMGNVAVGKDDLGEAAVQYRKSIALDPDNSAARIRLATINQINGMNNQATALLAEEENFNSYNNTDLGMCLAIDLHNANFGRAFETCNLIKKRLNDVNPSTSFIENFQRQAVFLFICYLPLFLGTSINVLYLGVLFTVLGLCAFALSRKTSLWHLFTFVFIGIGLLTIAQSYSVAAVYKALLSGIFYSFDGIWVLPKSIITAHLMALASFFIFPCFRVLKEDMRPAAYELLGVWLFCFFFSLFVLSFQADMPSLPKFFYMATGLFCGFLSALIMPLGRLMIFKFSKAAGIPTLGKISSSKISDSCESFTDFKILETRVWDTIAKGDLEAAKIMIRKNGGTESHKKYPKLWLASIVTQICSEEFETAIKSFVAFNLMYQGTEFVEYGQIYEAWLRTEKGDFPTAYKLINAISTGVANSMSADETAISLLVVARCCLNLKDNVQAHINLSKAFSSAKAQLLKHVILADLAHLDCRMNSKQAMQKWKKQFVVLSGEGKCKSYQNLISSMIAYSEGQEEKSFELAKKCLDDNVVNGKAIGWYGHLLCLKGKLHEAEKILVRMTAGSYEAECLITEVTSLNAS